MIQAIIFDCFGVLYRDNLALLHDLVPGDKTTELEDIIHACDHGFISRAEYFEQISDLTGKPAHEIRELEARQFDRNEDLFAYALSLKPRYKVGMLSNIGNETMDRLFTPEEKAAFDAFVLSSEEGLIKPARELFEITAEKLGVPPENCIMIDDRPANVEGAKVAGMRGILFTSNQQCQRDVDRLLGGE